MTAEWLPIRYRDFYDVPRLFIVWRGPDAYLFDSPFDSEIDEYSSSYSVYLLASELASRVDTISDWGELFAHTKAVGALPVSAVTFDQSKRQYIDATAFDHIDLEGR